MFETLIFSDKDCPLVVFEVMFIAIVIIGLRCQCFRIDGTIYSKYLFLMDKSGALVLLMF